LAHKKRPKTGFHLCKNHFTNSQHLQQHGKEVHVNRSLRRLHPIGGEFLGEHIQIPDKALQSGFIDDVATSGCIHSCEVFIGLDFQLALEEAGETVGI